MSTGAVATETPAQKQNCNLRFLTKLSRINVYGVTLDTHEDSKVLKPLRLARMRNSKSLTVENSSESCMREEGFDQTG